MQVLYQLFATDERDGEHRGRLIGDPMSVFVGRMKDMTSTSSADARTIELECYGRMSQQGKPPYGRWTHTDQQRRYPGDTGLELLATLKDKAITWCQEAKGDRYEISSPSITSAARRKN